MKRSNEPGLAKASRLPAWSGSTPAKIRFTGISQFLPLSVCPIALDYHVKVGSAHSHSSALQGRVAGP
jgi:hypothetical protein